MAYVYNQNQEEQAQQGSNIFAPAVPQQGGDGGVEKIGASGTPSAGVGVPLHGEYRAGQRTAQEVNQQAQGQREARRPLKAIFQRNQGDDVAQYDFGKIKGSIASASEAAQNAANQYRTSSLSSVPTMTESDLNVITGETPKPTPVVPSQVPAIPENAPINTLPYKVGSAPSAPGTGDNKAKPKTAPTPAAPSATPVEMPKNEAPASLPKTALPAPVKAPTEQAPTVENVYEKIMKILNPGQAVAGNFTLSDISVPTAKELDDRFGSLGGVSGELMKKYGSGMGRGAASIDASMLMKTPEFQQGRQDIQLAAKDLTNKRNELLSSVPEKTRQAVQDAMTAAADATKKRLQGKAGELEAPAKAAQKAYDTARGNIQAAINTGELTPDMATELLEFLKTNVDENLYSTGGYQFARGLLLGPDRGSRLSSLGASIDKLSGTQTPMYSMDFDPTRVFSVANTPTNATSFMSDDQFTPYARIMSLLGNPVTRGQTASQDMLSIGPEAGAAIRNYFNQAASMYDTNQKLKADAAAIEAANDVPESQAPAPSQPSQRSPTIGERILTPKPIDIGLPTPEETYDEARRVLDPRNW